MAKQNKKKLPTTVYVYWNDDTDNDEWLNAAETIDECASKGEKRIVGEYVLKGTIEVELEVKTNVKVTRN
jgi:heme-degrading monooxygenase HmoA